MYCWNSSNTQIYRHKYIVQPPCALNEISKHKIAKKNKALPCAVLPSHVRNSQKKSIFEMRQIEVQFQGYMPGNTFVTARRPARVQVSNQIF
jgi:hypothetical protein